MDIVHLYQKTYLAHVQSNLRMEDEFILSRVQGLISEVNSAMSD
ncbi:MAG: hypothetical protein ACE5J9_03105 [Methanosarcinales archaeon]